MCGSVHFFKSAQHGIRVVSEVFFLEYMNAGHMFIRLKRRQRVSQIKLITIAITLLSSDGREGPIGRRVQIRRVPVQIHFLPWIGRRPLCTDIAYSAMSVVN